MSLHRVFSGRSAPRSALAAGTLALCLLACGLTGPQVPGDQTATRSLRFKFDDGRLLTCSPDDQRLVSEFRQRDGPDEVRLWDLRSGRFLGGADLSELGWIGFATFSPNGRRLAVVDDKRRLRGPAFTIRVWDVTADGKLTNSRDLEADALYHGNAVYHASFSPNGDLVAAGTMAEQVVYLWDARSGQLKRRFQGGVTAHFAPDGQALIAVTHDGEVRRFDTATWKFLGPAQPFKRTDFILVSRAVLSPDGKRIALGDEWTTLVKDVETNRTLCRLNLPTATYRCPFPQTARPWPWPPSRARTSSTQPPAPSEPG